MSKLLLKYSSYLVSRSSFLTGIGNIFDFSGSYQKYNASKTSDKADTKAIYLDWLAVGDDLKSAVKNFELQKR